ncbi:MaoC family dehydratase [Stackebrandtia nassauensis]|uniref:MaoC domain protein dehydratase n=1 Tax=Stackebrandtia nassauensis (strain DSM 44728 / CIP 108903 / NRRL B-16338 / NBRC 102104 / LLR-40K-21) TaxID=446470 RepID=D3QAA5_STANL|nr:MaoC/PaaZ C-terminal domain-containing protein [Stackebrandtia nassauensis]ADD42688.1 MaoC domain protein dehydratase [Stackebrandtia nassauensis DSM 44728]
MRSHIMAQYPKAALSLLRRGRGDAASARLPEAELVSQDVTVDARDYARYCRLTGFRLSGELPVTYPHLLGFDAAMSLFTHREFPFSPVGMVHSSNRILQHSPLTVDDTLTVRVRLDNLAPHPKGATFDTVTEVERGGETAWSEASTYLIRTKSPDAEAHTRPRPEVDLDLDDLEALWPVPGYIGRRYAAVSGDYNPIHLHPLSARVFGQRRAIAHGMWALARCLGALENRIAPPPRVVETDFRRPLPLPSPKVALCTDREQTSWHFGLFNPKTAKSYLTGWASPA